MSMKPEPEIYCPKCKWRPHFSDRWSCVPGCLTSWNTFWTGGVCPGCAHQWTKTQCLDCHRFSPHKDWYHSRDGQRDQRRERRTKPEKVGS